jgi:hypothetical protein
MLGIGADELGPGCAEECLELLLLCCLRGGFKARSISANLSFKPVNLSNGPGWAGSPNRGPVSGFMVTPKGLAEYGPGCPLFDWFWCDMMPISWLGTGIWLENGGWRAVRGYGHTKQMAKRL